MPQVAVAVAADPIIVQVTQQLPRLCQLLPALVAIALVMAEAAEAEAEALALEMAATMDMTGGAAD